MKNLEPLYDFTRAVALADANRVASSDGVRAADGTASASCRRRARRRRRLQPRRLPLDACASRLARDAFASTQIDGGTDIPRATLDAGDAAAGGRRASAARRSAARAAARRHSGRSSERSDEQQGRWLLAYLLDYHRREDKATLVGLLPVCASLPEEELFDEREAVAGMEFVERVGCRDRQEGEADRIRDRPLSLSRAGDATSMSAIKGQAPGQERIRRSRRDRSAQRSTIDVRKGPTRAEVHPSAMFAFTHVSSDAMEDALIRIGERLRGVDATDAARRARCLAG